MLNKGNKRCVQIWEGRRQMKKIIKRVCFLMMMLGIALLYRTEAEAATTGTDGDYTYSVEEDSSEATITGYTGTDSDIDITIPSTLGGYTVTAIGASAFKNNNNIKTVLIPSSVLTIGALAFEWCEGLEKVIIENGCKTIESRAFACANLTYIKVPQSVTTIEYFDQINEAFSHTDRDKLTVYGAPNSTIDEFMSNYKADYKFYYLNEYSPDSIEFSNPTLTLNVEDTYTFSKDDFVVGPETAYVTMPSDFSTSDNTIAYISNGVLTARKEGTIIINATISDEHLEKSVTTTVPLTVVENRKAVESVSLNVDDYMTLYVGDTLQLEATVSPSDATYTSSWGTTKSGIASVTDTGLVTALSAGTVQVGYDTRSVFGNVYDNNGKYILLNVVEKPLQAAKSVTFNVESPETIYVGDTLQLKPTVLPSNAVYIGSWYLSSYGVEGVATISSSGLVTALKEGHVQIEYLTITDGSNGASGLLDLYIKEKTTTTDGTDNTDNTDNSGVGGSSNEDDTIDTQQGNITLNASKISIQKGKTIKTLAIKVNQLSEDRIASVTSSNKKVVNASLSGQKIVLKGVKTNSKYVTITVKMKSGAKATCKVRVVSSVVNTKKLSISDKKLSLLKGDSEKLTITRNPISATDKITWKSSNTKVAIVDKNGKVKANSAGKATITAASASGKKVTCKVTVSNVLNADTISLQKGKTITTLKVTAKQLKGDSIASVKSSNTKVLKASLEGQTIVLKGLKTSSKYVTVTVKMTSGAKGTCKVKVVKSSVKTQKITVDDTKKTLTTGSAYQLTVTRDPISATDKITYKSSNKKVVTVDTEGNLLAKKKGKATITVTTTSGKKTACKVTVK